MMKNVDHIGIAVKDLDKAESLYTNLLGIEPYKRETIESQKVKTSFYKVGETHIELLESLTKDGPIANFIKKRGEGIHHMAYEVEDLKEEMIRCIKAGFKLINKKPHRGANNKWVCFLHPKSCNGVLVELCQKIL